jgi:hypothetical protein
MEEKWMRDPITAILAGVAIIGFGFYAILAAAGVVPWSQWWSYLLISVGFALAIELPIRMLKRSYRLHGLGEWWLALSIIAFGFTILTFGLWWWLGKGRR